MIKSLYIAVLVAIQPNLVNAYCFPPSYNKTVEKYIEYLECLSLGNEADLKTLRLEIGELSSMILKMHVELEDLRLRIDNLEEAQN